MAEKTLQEQFAEADERLAPEEARADLSPLKEKAKKSYAPMRTGLVFLLLLLIAGATFLVYQVFSHYTNSSTSPATISQALSSPLVAATVSPPLGPPPPAQSQNNVIEVQSSGQVLGANTNDQAINQETNRGNSDYRCPDALGDTIACLPSWYKP